MHEVASGEVLRSICFAWMDLNHSINSCGKKMIDICCVGRGVKYHSLSYWSIVMKSKWEFFDQWISRQTGMKSPFGRLGSFPSHMARCIYSSLDPVSFQFQLINWSATTSAAKIDLSSDTSFWILWPILTELNTEKVTFWGKIHRQFRFLHTTLWKLILSVS